MDKQVKGYCIPAPDISEEQRRTIINGLVEAMPPKGKIFVLRGLPASGKSTLATKMTEDGTTKRINKDLLREMLHGGKYTPELEDFVTDTRNMLIRHILETGHNVVVDDTNLNPKHIEVIQVIAFVHKVPVEIIDVDTPLDECIRRDSVRDNPVGEDVIRGMYDKYIK
jgi:predicted kinase